MNVSEAVKNAYRSDSKQKEIRVFFPDLNKTISTADADSETMSLKESLSEGDSVEFVGCIASEFKITVRGLFDNVKNERIEAYISSDGTEEIPLFHGKVDGVTISADKSKKTLSCYDSLYSMGNMDIAKWYKSLAFGRKQYFLRTLSMENRYCPKKTVCNKTLLYFGRCSAPFA